MEQTRLYTFVNYYLSPLQHGLQTAHLVSELFKSYQYDEGTLAHNRLWSWASSHKTIIILKGGNSLELETFFDQRLRPLSPEYPAAIFHEDQQSLSGACTVAGIILPEEMYDSIYNEPEEYIVENRISRDYVHRTVDNKYTVWTPGTSEWGLLNDLKNFRLA